MAVLLFKYMILAIIYWFVEHARKGDITEDISHLITLVGIYLYKLYNYSLDYLIKKLNNTNNNNITENTDKVDSDK